MAIQGSDDANFRKSGDVSAEVDRSYRLSVHVGGRIRVARLEKGLTFGDLAEQLQLEDTKLMKLEQGEVKIEAEELWRLCQCLRLPMSFFFSMSEYAEGKKVPIEALVAEAA